MAFSIKLYNVSDDPRKLNKTLTGELPVDNVRPTDIVDLMNPSFILNYEESYTTKNYLWADAPFNRFYFITDMKIDIGKKIVISCAVDVLYTYHTEINKIKTNIFRSSSRSNNKLADPEYCFEQGFENRIELFNLPPTGGVNKDFFIENGKYVLNYLGGANLVDESYVPVIAEPADWTINWFDYYVYAYYSGAQDYYKLSNFIDMSAQPGFEAVQHAFGTIYRYVGN